MNISDYLRHFREVNGMTQDQLSELMGVSRQAISKWECGESLPEIENLVFLSDLYDVSVDELLRGARFLPKPFVIGEFKIKRKLWLGLGLSLFLAMLMSGGTYFPLFVALFLGLNLISISMLKEGRMIVAKKEVRLVLYPNLWAQIRGIFSAHAYERVLSYGDLSSCEIRYKARVRFSPIDFGPDVFVFVVRLNDGSESVWEVDNHLYEYLPILCDFLSKKGVHIDDANDVLMHIVKGNSVYEAMHQ